MVSERYISKILKVIYSSGIKLKYSSQSMNIRKFLQIIPSFKLKYLPFITVYFAYNFANFSQIAETFWVKNSLNISAVEITSIGVWSMLPWSMKIIFGQMLDSIKIFGSQRRIYIFLGGFLMLLGNLITILIANNYFTEVSVYSLLVFAAILSNIGFVLQDIVADTLCYEIVDKKDSNNKLRDEEEVKKEIANIQILIRVICIPFASMIALYVGGIIAEKYSFALISYFLPINTFIGILGSIIINKEPKVSCEKPQRTFIIAAAIYFFGLIIISLASTKFSQELTLCLGLIIVITALYKLTLPLPKANQKELFAILVVCFAARCVPNYGIGIEWWQIDELQFNPEFFARLKQIGIITGFFGLFFLGKRIASMHVGFVLLMLNLFEVILQLPIIGMGYGLHEWTLANFGFGAKTIAFIDTSTEGIFSQLQFFIICTVATYKAPKHNIAMWFALSMSLMSLAWIFKRIINRLLAQNYIVERGMYDNVPDLMIATTSLTFLIPTITILIFMNPFKKEK